MRKGLIVFLIVFVFTLSAGTVLAKKDSEQTFVLYDTATLEVLSISPENDAVVQTGQTEYILEEKYKNVIKELTAQVTDYKFINNEFVKDLDKISARENAIIQSNEKSAELKKVINRSYKDACEALVGEGLVFVHINCSDFD